MANLKTITNGARATPMFSAPETARRVNGLRVYLAEAGIAAVLFTSYHNINYFSSFLYCSFGRPYGLVVTQEDFTTISANIDGGQPKRRSEGGNLVYTDWMRDNYFAAVKRLITDRGRVGIETDHLIVQNHQKLKAKLSAGTKR
jgi:creatinase